MKIMWANWPKMSFWKLYKYHMIELGIILMLSILLTWLVYWGKP
jgi:hypothetical protein